jgi:hypothetical protein
VLAAALEFIRLKHCSNPISMLVCGLLRAAVFIGTGAESPQKPRPGTVSTLQLQLRGADLMAWGSGGFPSSWEGRWDHLSTKGKP